MKEIWEKIKKIEMEGKEEEVKNGREKTIMEKKGKWRTKMTRSS